MNIRFFSLPGEILYVKNMPPRQGFFPLSPLPQPCKSAADKSQTQPRRKASAAGFARCCARGRPGRSLNDPRLRKAGRSARLFGRICAPALRRRGLSPPDAGSLELHLPPRRRMRKVCACSGAARKCAACVKRLVAATHERNLRREARRKRRRCALEQNETLQWPAFQCLILQKCVHQRSRYRQQACSAPCSAAGYFKIETLRAAQARHANAMHAP